MKSLSFSMLPAGNLCRRVFMAQITARRFMEKTAMGGGAAGALAEAATPSDNVALGPLGFPIGCQIWPMRSMLGDFPKFVRMVADLGVARLELCSPLGYGEEFSS